MCCRIQKATVSSGNDFGFYCVADWRSRDKSSSFPGLVVLRRIGFSGAGFFGRSSRSWPQAKIFGGAGCAGLNDRDLIGRGIPAPSSGIEAILETLMHKKLSRIATALVLALSSNWAHADQRVPDGNFRLSGFGTVAVSRTTVDDAMFNYPGQGGGATRHASLNPDSKVALQGAYSFSSSVSATAQVLMKYDAEGQYIPDTQWLFAKWQATPNWVVRAGRMGAPFFMVSDSRDVGYAMLTVRPPLDVYGQVPVSQFEGVDTSYQLAVGPASITTTLWSGSAAADFTAAAIIPPNRVILKKLVGLNLVADIGSGLTVRAGHVQSRMTVKSPLADQVVAASNDATLRTGLQSLSPSTLDQIDGALGVVEPDSVRATFSGVGLSYEEDNWVGSFEYTKRKTASYIAKTTGWYAALGYRVRAFTPYVGWSRLKSSQQEVNPIQIIATASAGLNDAVQQLSGGVDALLNSQRQSQRTTTLGARWDLATGVALKAQFDQIKKPKDSNGLFLNPDPTNVTGMAFLSGKRVINVLTLSMDFVY